MSKNEKINCACDDEVAPPHNHGDAARWKIYLPSIISFALLALALITEHLIKAEFFTDWIRALWYLAAYFPVGLPVLKSAWKNLLNGQLFTEFFLMSLATIGAFFIGEYPEGVAVMLFYTIGELFQAGAVKKAKKNIKALLDIRPNIAHVFRNGKYVTTHPDEIKIGENIQVKVGEKIPLDGILISEKAILNTAALTGESKPTVVFKNGRTLAGSINLENVVELKVDKLFNESSIARILHLVQNATSRKSKTELLIRRLAKIYTPIVTYLALAICFLPYFFVSEYIFSDWLYRALIFLVISCPCALVISIPLGYFGGLGAASQNGLLFKGASFLDQLTKVNTLVLDKTGTLTKGVFKIKEIHTSAYISEKELMQTLMALEKKSNHPIALAIMQHTPEANLPEAIDVREIAGRGLTGNINGKNTLAGNIKLMEEHHIDIPSSVKNMVESTIIVSIDKKYMGHITIADELKADAKSSILAIKKAGIKNIIMLSGDKDSITQKVADALGIKKAKGGLLPEGKLHEVEKIKENKKNIVAFVGDGINDAPVLAASDVGIAMGALGSDIAIETADVIIQTDQPSKIVTGIKIGKATQGIIWQNIYLALGVKILVIIAGAFGMATMWQAVFADVGVALLAILNAVRLQKMKWTIE